MYIHVNCSTFWSWYGCLRMPSDAFGCLRMPSGSVWRCFSTEVLKATPRELKCITPCLHRYLHISTLVDVGCRRGHTSVAGDSNSFGTDQPRASHTVSSPAMPSYAQLGHWRISSDFNIFQQISTLSSGLPDANRRCFFSMLANCGKLCRHRQFQYLLAIAVSSAAQVMARWSSQLACMWWPVAQIPTGWRWWRQPQENGARKSMDVMENNMKKHMKNPGWWFGTMEILWLSIGNIHPNWRTHIFQRGRYTAN